MTRKSKRELERTLDDFSDQTETGDNEFLVGYRDPVTGELSDGDGNLIDEDESDGLLVVIDRSVVMSREQAEAEGREILGPAEDAVEDDIVRVAPQ